MQLFESENKAAMQNLSMMQDKARMLFEATAVINTKCSEQHLELKDVNEYIEAIIGG